MTELYKLLNSNEDWDTYFTKVDGTTPEETVYLLKWATTSDKQAHYKKIKGFSMNTDDMIYAPLYSHSNTTFSGGIFIYIKAGGYYYLVGLFGDTSDSNIYLSYDKLTSIDISSISPTKTGKYYSLSTPRWFAVGFKRNGSNLDIMFNSESSMPTDYHSHPPTGAWTSYGSIAIDSEIITEFGFCSIDFTGAPTTNYSSIKYIHLDWQELSTNIGGTLDIQDPISKEFVKSTGAGGGGTIVVPADSYNLSKYQSNLLAEVFVYLDNGVEFAKYYVRDIVVSGNTIVYNLEEDIKLFTKSICDYNPISHARDLMRSAAAFVGEPYSEFTVDEFKDKYATIVKNDLYINLAEVSSIGGSYLQVSFVSETYYGVTPYSGSYNYEGFYYRLYYDDPTVDNHWACLLNPYATMNAGPVIEFTGYLRDETVSFNNVQFQLSVSTRCRKDSYIGALADYRRPSIFLWNYTTSEWVLFEYFSENRYSIAEDTDDWTFGYLQQGSGTDVKKAPKLMVTIDLLVTYYMIHGSYITADDFKSDYMDFDTGNESDSGFVPYTVKMFFASGQNVATDNWRSGLEFYLAKIKLSGISEAQGGWSASAKVTSNTASTIYLSTSGINADYPVDDGAIAGDLLIIGDTYYQCLENIFSNDSKWSLDMNISDNKVCVLDDISYMSKHDFLQRFGNIYNVLHYSSSTEIENILSVRFNLDATGIVLTKDDIVGYYNDEWSLTIDGDHFSEKIVIDGRDLSIVKRDGYEYSVYIQNPLESTSAVYRYPDIDDFPTLEKHAMSKLPIQSYYNVAVELTIDISREDRDYSTIGVGKTIGLQLPDSSDTSICDFSSGNELLFIERMIYRPYMGRGFVTLLLSRRVV